MSGIVIEMTEGRTRFLPGELIDGVVAWDLPESTRSIEVRLFWYTQGKGTEDVEIVVSLPLIVEGRTTQQSFQFKLPDSPYSFSGQLITLTWAIEAIAMPTNEVGRLEIVVSPWAQDLVLTQVVPKKKASVRFSNASG